MNNQNGNRDKAHGPASKGTIESSVVGVSDEVYEARDATNQASPDDFIVDQARRLATDTPKSEATPKHPRAKKAL